MVSWPSSLHFIVPPHSEGFGLGGKLEPQRYLDRLVAYMDAAERIGVYGAFVYDFPVALDPWLAAFDVLAFSSRLEPIVAVRRHQESPEAVARRVADLCYRFGRPTHVNVVAGATTPSRSAADAEDPLAARERLGSFAQGLREDLQRRLGPGDRSPSLFTPASKTPGVVPADCALMMARPRPVLAGEIARVRAEQGVDRVAMLIGFVVRDTGEEAWRTAAALYPPDRRQQVAGQMFMAQVVSSEHTSSYAFAEQQEIHDEHLWYGAPLRGIDAPKLVGSYGQARAWLLSCRDLGVTDVIIDLVPDPSEYAYIGRLVASLP